MNLLFRLAVKNLIGAGLRTWLNVIVLSFSFLIIIWHKGLLDGWDRQAKNETIKWEIGGGQYWHSSYDPYDPFSLTEAHAKIPFSLDSLVSSGKIAPILITQGTIYPRGRIQSILIKGINSDQKLLKIPSSLFIKDSDDIPAIIGKNIKIIGIFNSDVPTVDMGQVWIPLDRLQKMMDMPGEATIIVSDKEQKDKILSGEWKFMNNEVLLKSITDLIKMKSVSGYVLYIILLSLAMLAIFDTQVLSIFRRQKEIGTYIALGMTRRQVVGLFTIEGSLNSVLAGILAALYGIPMLALQASRGLSLPGGSKGFGLAVADRIYPVYSLGLVITTILLILLTTTIVSYIPSRKIAKMKPTDALRGKIQ